MKHKRYTRITRPTRTTITTTRRQCDNVKNNDDMHNAYNDDDLNNAYNDDDACTRRGRSQYSHPDNAKTRTTTTTMKTCTTQTTTCITRTTTITCTMWTTRTMTFHLHFTICTIARVNRTVRGLKNENLKTSRANSSFIEKNFLSVLKIVTVKASCSYVPVNLFCKDFK